MLRFAADENFNADIVRVLVRRNPKLDIVRVRDVPLARMTCLFALDASDVAAFKRRKFM